MILKAPEFPGLFFIPDPEGLIKNMRKLAFECLK
jgi:hypothetical protein